MKDRLDKSQAVSDKEFTGERSGGGFILTEQTSEVSKAAKKKHQAAIEKWKAGGRNGPEPAPPEPVVRSTGRNLEFHPGGGIHSNYEESSDERGGSYFRVGKFRIGRHGPFTPRETFERQPIARIRPPSSAKSASTPPLHQDVPENDSIPATSEIGGERTDLTDPYQLGLYHGSTGNSDVRAAALSGPQLEQYNRGLEEGKASARGESVQKKVDEVRGRRVLASAHPNVTRAPFGGVPLTPSVREKMEGSLGADLSGVRVHEGPEAESIGAKAYARGNHLYFQPGTHRPELPAGQQLLSHELAHVMQQRAGRVRSPRNIPGNGGGMVVDDPALELEADRLAAAASSPTREQLTGRRGEAVATGDAGSSIQRKVIAHRSGRHWVSTLTGGTYDSEEAAHSAEADLAHDRTEFLKQRRASITASAQDPSQPAGTRQATNRLGDASEEINAIKAHAAQKAKDQGSLQHWNVNAGGRSQGLVHLLDYAYARPAKLAVENPTLLAGERELLERTDRDALSGAELQQKLGPERFGVLRKYLQSFGVAPEQTERSQEQKKADDLRPVGVPEDAHVARLAELSAAKEEVSTKGRAFGKDRGNEELKLESEAAKARATRANSALEDNRRFVLARDVSKHGRLASIAAAAGRGAFARGQEIEGATQSIRDIVAEKAPNVTSRAPTRTLTDWQKVDNRWQPGEIQPEALSNTLDAEVRKDSLNIKLWGVLPKDKQHESDEQEKRKHLKISTAI